MSFIRKKEDFICEQCEAAVTGNGYTNHCPRCLWSKHVDLEPGDRLSDCHGPMKPLVIRQKHQTFIIDHLCQTCGHIKSNHASPQDDINAIVRLTDLLLKE